MTIHLNIDNARSYKTEANLDKALAKRLPGVKYLTVCNRDGRFTAVVSVAWNPGLQAFDVSCAGYMVLN
jgi:hypothetical protein